jgi:hypothetical protein
MALPISGDTTPSALFLSFLAFYHMVTFFSNKNIVCALFRHKNSRTYLVTSAYTLDYFMGSVLVGGIKSVACCPSRFIMMFCLNKSEKFNANA